MIKKLYYHNIKIKQILNKNKQFCQFKNNEENFFIIYELKYYI